MVPAPDAPAGGDPYLLGSSAAELDHLAAQAEVYAPEAEQLLDAIGVRPGLRAIDLGCGVLGAVGVLARRAGPDGHVVGLDREPRMVAAARAIADDRGLAAEFVQADATATGLADAGFDLVHARTLLLNVTDAEAVVTEMLRICRPGGVVAVQEPDASAWTCDPPHPAWDALRDAVTGAYRLAGKDFSIGRRSARLLRDAGLREVRTRPTARSTVPGDYYQTFLLTIAALVRDGIVGGGLLTSAECDDAEQQLRAHLEAPGTNTCQPLIWQAWGRKPRPAS